MLTLVLLPGLACDAEVFRDLLPALPPSTAVSRVHESADTLPAMADALLAQFPGPLLLAGCSMGGMVALHAHLRAPQRVRGLALLGASARADTPELIRLRTAAIGHFEKGRVDEVLLANVQLAFHPTHARDRALVQRYVAMVHRAGAGQLIRQNRAVMARADLRPRLPEVTCPTLVVCGEADLLTPPEQSREIAEGIPGAQLELLPGAGHMLTMEQPQRVGALLAAWVQRFAAGA